jgi:thioredoxin 1
MIVVDKDNFEKEVQNGDLPVIVDMWGPQCVPCLALMPHGGEAVRGIRGKDQVL